MNYGNNVCYNNISLTKSLHKHNQQGRNTHTKVLNFHGGGEYSGYFDKIACFPSMRNAGASCDSCI